MKKVKITIEFDCADTNHPEVAEFKEEILNGSYQEELDLSGAEIGISGVKSKWEEE